MGLATSRYSDNDFELAVRAAKDLEWILEQEFTAEGKGLHEKITSAAKTGLLPSDLVKKMRFLASLRNKLVHERGFDCIPDRAAFIKVFEEAHGELQRIVQKNGLQQKSMCIIC